MVRNKPTVKHQAKQKERNRWMVSELLRLGRLQQAAMCCSTMYRSSKSIDDGLLLAEIWVRMGNRKTACSKHLRRLLVKLKKSKHTQLVVESVGVCGQLLMRLQDYQSAEQAFVMQCMLANELHGHLHVITSDCFMTTSAFYHHCAQEASKKQQEKKQQDEKQRYQSLACQFAGKALLVRINVLGEHDKRTAACHNNLGLVLRAEESFESERSRLRHLFSIWEGYEIERRQFTTTTTSS